MSDRAAAFSRILRLEPHRTALLIVDMQRGFVDPGQALDIVARAFGRVVQSKEVLDTISSW